MTSKPPSYSPSQPCRLSDVPQWEDTSDILIVGFGVAGACAALEAAAAGAQCTLFEMASAPGGSTAMSGGEFYFGGNGGTAVQRAHGYEDATEDFYQYMMMVGGPGADAERVGLFANQALEHYEWLMAQGVPFKGTFHQERTVEPMTDDTLLWSGSEAAWPFCERAKPAPRGHAVQKKGKGAGKVLMEKLAEKIAAHENIVVKTDTRVIALIVENAGNTENSVPLPRVHGVVVRSAGIEQYYRANKGVILCAGGFVSNEDMLRRYTPDALRLGMHVSAGNDNGSGIRMGMALGGAAIHMDQFFSTRPFIPPECLIKGVFINERGQRFINEDAYHGRIGQHLMRQPNGNAWLLVDQSIFERPMFNPGIEIAAVGESWDEIERELQLPEGELVHTLEAYNRHAAQGADPLFHKNATWLKPLNEPPYAAMSIGDASWPAAGFTLGGLATLTTGQVINPEGQIIPGLYAAGRTACGLPRWGEGYSSGMSLSDASFFGRLAGRHLATSV